MNRTSLLLSAALAPLVACQPEPEPEPTDTDIEPIAVSIPFEARFREEIATCGPEYDHVGLGDDSVKLQDLRMFVHDVQLITAGGEAVAVTLDPSEWVYESVALLDFEDAQYPCDATAPTKTTLDGTVPPGDYVGLRFIIGVPFGINHVDPTLYGPPLDAVDMFANTQDGHSFFRMEFEIGGTNPPNRFPIDVRSIGCVNSPGGGVTEECASPDRLTVELPAFNLETGKVAMQLERLVVRNDVDRNQGGALGCASEASDQDCRDFFVAYGLGINPPTWIFAE